MKIHEKYENFMIFCRFSKNIVGKHPQPPRSPTKSGENDGKIVLALSADSATRSRRAPMWSQLVQRYRMVLLEEASLSQFSQELISILASRESVQNRS